MADYENKLLALTDGKLQQVHSTDTLTVGGTLTSGGIAMSGDITLPDDVKLKAGTGGDLEIFHDGSNSIIKDTADSGSSSIKYLAGTQTFQNNSANKTMAVLNASTSVDLYYNGNQKFETTNDGVKTTGTLDVNNAYTLPLSDGIDGQVLTTNGSGAISFTTVSSGSSHTVLDSNVSATDLVSEAHYVLPYNATANVSITLPDEDTAGAGDFFQKTFKVENRSDTYNVNMSSVGTLNNSYRYYNVNGTLIASGSLSDAVPPKTTRLFYVGSYSAGSYIYWNAYNDILAYPVEHLGNVNITSLSDGQALEYSSSSSSWVNVDNSGSGWTVESKSDSGGNFSAQTGYYYLVNNTNTSTPLRMTLPTPSVGNRIRAFNFGVGTLEIRDSGSQSDIDPNDGTIGFQDYKRFDQNCIIDIVCVATGDYEWVVSPQIEIDGQGSLSTTGQVLYYDASSNKNQLQALPYIFPSSDGNTSQVLGTNGSGVLSFVDQGGMVYSAITADPSNAQAGYHYSCTGTFTITLPTSGVSAGAEIRVKNMGTGTITIDPQTSTIDGATTDYVLDTQYSAITLVSTSTNWESI